MDTRPSLLAEIHTVSSEGSADGQPTLPADVRPSDTLEDSTDINYQNALDDDGYL